MIARVDIERLIELDPEIAKSVFLLYKELIRIKNELVEAKKSEKEAWTENISYKAELEAYRKQVEILETALSQLKSKFEEKVRRYNMMKLEIEDLEMRTAIAETSYLNLLDALERMHELVSRRYIEDIPEMVRKEMMSNIDMLIEHVKSVLESVKGVKAPVPAGGE